MKKKLKIIYMLVLLALCGIFYSLNEQNALPQSVNDNNEQNVIYQSVHDNFSHGEYHSEEKIYFDGKITWYSKFDNQVQNGSAQLSSEELENLKSLIKESTTKMVRSDLGLMTDGGQTKANLYRPDTREAIELYRLEEGIRYYNEDENAKKCEDMINELFRKYQNEHI